jgi:hypothetical protein
MFRVLASTGSKPYQPAKGFQVGMHYVYFETPQKEGLKFYYRDATPTELIRWCETRLNNATNSKNKIKLK